MMRSSSLRWMALVTLAFGLLFSTIGATSSHGSAVLAAMDHGIGSSLDQKHGHSHGDDGDTGADTDSDHPHHSNDHSHDSPHALAESSRAWRPEPSIRLASTDTRARQVFASRLERPPRMDYCA
ncbi:MAG: hypothetical protein J0H00_00805 [Burkholderiales bacterium]|nr:hypothetical protein [Burkholderiales bacterium]